MELIKIEFGLFFWTVVVFLIFFFILRKYAWGPILEGIKKREETIEGSLAEAKNARDEMAKLQAKNEALLKEARKERDALLKEANKMKDIIITEAKAKAEEEATKVLERANQQMESDRKALLEEIKVTSGALAVDIAEKILRKQFADRTVQQSLADQLISELNNN